MLLGVHIPKEALDTGEISGMVQKYKKTWRIFQGWNIAASVAVCFLCFVDFIVFMIVWTVWLMEYIAGLLYLVYHPHRKLYRIKIKNGWVREESRRIVRIDTGVSVQSDRMALSLKWHIPGYRRSDSVPGSPFADRCEIYRGGSGGDGDPAGLSRGNRLFCRHASDGDPAAECRVQSEQ